DSAENLPVYVLSVTPAVIRVIKTISAISKMPCAGTACSSNLSRLLFELDFSKYANSSPD
ncbi:hypothetical protein BgiMline_005650, partial [Biomphalaria glabrata]